MAQTPNLLHGTLDLLILHSLQRGSLHDYAIAQTMHLLSNEVLTVEAPGRKHLAAQQQTWNRFSTAVQQVLAS